MLCRSGNFGAAAILEHGPKEQHKEAHIQTGELHPFPQTALLGAESFDASYAGALQSAVGDNGRQRLSGGVVPSVMCKLAVAPLLVNA